MPTSRKQALAVPSWRRLPVGAELAPDGRTHLRVWAPARERVEVVVERDDGSDWSTPLDRDETGYHAGFVTDAPAGTRYRFRLDGGDRLYPDPASRAQPDGPHGASQVVDPSAYTWHDGGWRGCALAGQVIYELHVGTFTPEGTWAAAERELPELAATGITLVEVMPVAEFPGRFGWGYDGVDLFAPYHGYGTPDDFRRFVDAAHAAGVGVILDVVYNHLGPSGNYLREFTPHYFSERHRTDWGDAINFDGPDAGPVREFFTANASYWIAEFHLDGLRLDATQEIYDDSPRHILAEIGASAREAAGERAVLLVAENERQDTRLLRPIAEGGYGLDMTWNDDFHHTALVALTGHDEAYYRDYRGTPQEFLSAAKRGYLYQGQHYQWQGAGRGGSSRGLAPARFVAFLENHDQLSNFPFGLRTHVLGCGGRQRALTAWLLLGPHTPLLFQGQEFGASTPWLYFADHEPELATQVFAGRRRFLAQFPSAATPEVQSRIANPADPATFERCRLDLAERERHAGAYAMHRDLLRLRREDPVVSRQGTDGMDGAVLSDDAFCFRWLAPSERDDRLLVVNLGRTLHDGPAPEPLLAPPAGTHWRIAWDSEDPRYGGQGMPAVETSAGIRIHGESAALLVATPAGTEELPDAADQPPTHD
jgi:maltooligosyltrehalose trehalohydrolase